ncbi:Amino acid permease. membrane protein [Propionibacterium freudenreichii subsp. freudenreichii]|uniref:Amino acid permease. membrane protein n=1 Tax=Propionibacterium freudenreichii subsp. freudenreichii TaxID=66712 RepID=A0A0B7NXR8_PROFF|nr:Amino acid permease. membrane protein [Propionibacterium freudenreichii subsp. freudenreichii]
MSSSEPVKARPAAPMVDKADAGYQKGLKTRHIRMIAIGGSIGTGLFLGAGGRLAKGGPALAISYAICGIFAFIMVRALGELSVHRPSSGAFVSYAREFMGEKGAYTTGWLFFLDWSTTVMADITAVALYLHYWRFFEPIPQWLLAMIALAVVFALNMFSVKYFGEAEFWFAAIKVVAIVAFMAVAIWAIITGHAVANEHAGFANLTNHGGFFPMGVAPMLTLSLGVIFAFGGTEMVGVAAGEAKDAVKILPKAVNSMIVRIFVFYVGSVVLMTLVLPWSSYSANESPFVTFFSDIGVPHAGDIMQIVVLTAALSSLNAGLYATGRTLRSMAVAGEAPKFASKLNKSHVPYGGIIITAGLGLIGVLINYVYPTNAFEIVMNLAGIGIAGTWISILVSHLIFTRRAAKGLIVRPSYQLRGAPYTNIVAILFFVAVIGSMWFDPDVGRKTILMFGGVVVLMVAGWFAVRKRIHAELMDTILDDDGAAAPGLDDDGAEAPGTDGNAAGTS